MMFDRKKPEWNEWNTKCSKRSSFLHELESKMRGYAEAVVYTELPLRVLIPDSPEYKAVKQQANEYRLDLRNAMGVYDTERAEFSKWFERHKDELTADYRERFLFPDTSLELITYTLSRCDIDDYWYFKHCIKKIKKGG